MIISKIEMQKLQASKGMVLTNGEAYSSVGGVVYLPETSDVSKWHEITEDDYKDIMTKDDEVTFN